MWTKGNYRRIFLDMHIDDSREEYLSKLDPESLCTLLKNAGAQQIVVKCRPWSGLAYYPTKIGRMHKGLKGIDYVGKMSKLCHDNGIAVMGFFSMHFDNYAFHEHPEWRAVNAFGMNSLEMHGRYCVVCSNNIEYRDYVKNCLTEIVSKYEMESIFLDMPFWMNTCYCPSCKERYLRETGKEIPAIINWDDPDFRAFQYRREQWMGEFAQFVTSCVKEANPNCTTEHNLTGMFVIAWPGACSELVNDSNDYSSGDLYGGYLEQSFVCKYFRNLTKTLPFVFITSRCDPGLLDHTPAKTMEQFVQHGIVALVHDGALSICDGINPEGTLFREVYEGPVKEAFASTQKYEKYVNGNYIKNASIWFSGHSLYDREDNGKKVSEVYYPAGTINQQCKIKIASILRTEHIPFDVIPGKSIENLKDDLLIISDVANILDDEMKSIEKYIMNGGNVYVSCKPGHPRLLELLEAEYVGDTENTVTYLSPTEKGMKYFEGFSKQYPLAIKARQAMLKFSGEFEALATLTLPYTLQGTSEFAAIHSDPPGIFTDNVCAVIKKVGKGKILWVGGAIEYPNPYMGRKVVGNMLRSLCGELKFESTAPSCVEIMSWIKDGKQYFSVINQQETPPFYPIHGVKIKVPFSIKSAKTVETGEALNVVKEGKHSVIEFPDIDIFKIIEIER